MELLICIKMDLALITYNGWWAIKPNQTLDYTIWGILENKTNATFHPNIGSLKTVIEEEWNKMFEEFSKACKLFWRCVDTITEKNGGYIQ